YSMAEKADENVGKMLAAIKEAGLEDDTIFVFTSDHGELFGAHGRRAKNIFYEEAVRVPFLMRCPGEIPVGENDVCLNTVDIMPTLLSMMGMKDDIPDEVEGRDLSDAVLGKAGADEPDGALMMGTGATAAWEDGHEWRAYRTKKYTYATYYADGSELLFDNENDPLQMKNLAAEPEYFETKCAIRNMMFAEMNRVGDKFHPSSYYRDNWCEDRIILKTKAD
ncbi:MAG: sulfatase-like hydrolase/transferase, partial [Eubacteriales bacterium]